MRTVIISDLHLGAGNCQADLLRTFLHDLSDDQLILNGDIFDHRDFRRLKKSHWKILKLIRKLAKRIPIIWLAGNHDGDAATISHLIGVKFLDEFVVESGGRRILVLHGHQFDDFLVRHPVWTWIGDVAHSFLQWADRTHRLARVAKRGSKKFLHAADKVRAGAVAYAREKGCDAVICGHMHHAEQVEGGSYVNCGCWTEKPCGFVMISDGRIDLCEYNNDGLSE